MFADRTTKKWHRGIIADAERKLGRKLTDNEAAFITSRGGFIALEMIHDTVKALSGKDLEEYLNSENV